MKIFIILLLVACYLSLVASPASAQSATKEEIAVYNRCEFNSPEEVCPTPQPPSTNSFQNFIVWLTSYLWQKPENGNKLKDQALAKQSALVPPEITRENATSQVSVEETIGRRDGIYGLGLPDGLIPAVVQPADQGSATECIYNNANFPEGVNVFTTSELCPADGKNAGQ